MSTELTAEKMMQALQGHANPEDALFLRRFFKTSKGQYGEGDVFIGVRVPMTRLVCKQFQSLPLSEIKKLLASEVHEHRLAAVILLANQYKKADEPMKQAIFDLYLDSVYVSRINNWDIVDSSAEFIIGEHLQNQSRDLLFELASSDNIWQRRVAVLSSFAFIKKGEPGTTLELAEVLLHDPQDLIQKAVGWMLREVGKRCGREVLIHFLEKHYKVMPRTMLRYAIEHLPQEQRVHFMSRA